MEVSFVPMQRVSNAGDVQTDEIRKASEVKKGFKIANHFTSFCATAKILATYQTN